MSGIRGQKWGETNPNARTEKMNIAVGKNDKKAILKFKDDNKIKTKSTACYDLMIIGLKKEGYIKNG